MKASLSIPAFRTALGNAALFSGKDKTRPALSSVLVEFDEAEVRFIATDSYALYRERVATDVHDESGSFLVDVDDVKRLLPALKGVVFGSSCADVVTDGDSMTVAIPGGTAFTLRRVPIDFPNYAQLFSSHNAGQVGRFGIGRFQLDRLGKIEVLGTKRNDVASPSPVKLEFGQTDLKPLRFYVGSSIDGLLMPTRLP